MIHNFSKNTICYCFLQNTKLFNLILTVSKGWGIMILEKNFFLVKKKEIFPYLLKEKSYLSLLRNIFLGFYKGYSQYLKLKGMGYKFMTVKKNLILKFGFSHRIVFMNYTNIYCKFITRYLLRFESRSLCTLKKIYQIFTKIRKNNTYKKKGLFFKGSVTTIKTSSKKSKF